MNSRFSKENQRRLKRRMRFSRFLDTLAGVCTGALMMGAMLFVVPIFAAMFKCRIHS